MFLVTTGSVVDSCVLGEGCRKVVSSSPGQVTWNIYFHFICVLSYIGLPNNMFWSQRQIVVLINQIFSNIRDHSANITGGWRLFNFGQRNLDDPVPRIGRICVPPSEDWQNLGTTMYPPTYNILITPLYVFYGLMSYFSLLIINIWQNLHVPHRKIGKIWVPPCDEWQNLGTP